MSTTTSQQRQRTRRRSTINALAVILWLALGVFVAYRERCRVIACEPASWVRLSEIIGREASAAGGYRVGRVEAEPAYGSRTTDDGPEELTIRVELISRAPARDSSYPVRTFELSDLTQIVSTWSGNTFRGGTPAEESERRFGRVRVSPRDAFRATWALAHAELGPSFSRYRPSARLYTDDSISDRFGVESAWGMLYMDERSTLVYWVDAQTGAVVRTVREDYSP